jgi:hypothetical protein
MAFVGLIKDVVQVQQQQEEYYCDSYEKASNCFLKVITETYVVEGTYMRSLC